MLLSVARENRIACFLNKSVDIPCGRDIDMMCCCVGMLWNDLLYESKLPASLSESNAMRFCTSSVNSAVASTLRSSFACIHSRLLFMRRSSRNGKRVLFFIAHHCPVVKTSECMTVLKLSVCIHAASNSRVRGVDRYAGSESNKLE